MKALRHADIPLAVLATAWLAWSIWRFPAWTVDDAFIVARYADNVVAHGELAFNAGGPAADRVEGFTSPLATTIAVLARALGGNAIAVTKDVAMLAALSTPSLVVIFARVSRASRLAGGGAALLLAALPEHAIHARSGLETEIFVACVFALLIGFARVMDRRARVRAFVVPACLTIFARPEGMAFVAALGVCLLFARPSSERRVLARGLALGIAMPIVVLSIARIAYFGALLPNTFYAKSGGWHRSQLTDPAALADIFAVDVVVLGAAAFALCRILALRMRAFPPRLARATVAACGILVFQTSVYARTAPIMDYGRRFAWHGVALMAVIVVAALDIGARAAIALSRTRVHSAVASLTAIAIMVTWNTVRSESTAQREAGYVMLQENSVPRLQEPLLRWITENTAPDTLIAVYPDAGRMPFYTRRPTIDFGKLNDRFLARVQTDDDVVRYFFERNPAVIVMARYASGELWDTGAEAIVRDPRFNARYVLARRLPDAPDPSGATYDIYRRAR